MLKIQDLHVYYGGIHALKGISLEVPKGKVVTLIGCNGAGKSSTLRSIAGLIKNKKGRITYNGKDLSRLGPVEVRARCDHCRHRRKLETGRTI